MPTTRRTASVCAESGCPTITTNTRCAQHARDTDYGKAHRHVRARWQRRMRRGETVYCARGCGTQINPDQPWHLDHTNDRTTYLGPSCQTCNSGAHA